MSKVLIVIVAATVVVFAAFGWLMIVSPVPDDASSFASWAQAVGTVGAVLIAVALAVYQNDHAAGVRRAETMAREAKAFATFRVCSERVVQSIADVRARVIEKRADNASAQTSIEVITSAVHQLEAIPVADFGSHRASLAAARFTGKARETTLTLRTVADNPNITEAIIPQAFKSELDDLTTWRKLVMEEA